MNVYEEQTAILYSLLQKQKQRIGDPELKKKLAFLLFGDSSSKYKEKISELTAIINICEGLLITQKYQRTLYYVCVIVKKIDHLQKSVEKDFLNIQRRI